MGVATPKPDRLGNRLWGSSIHNSVDERTFRLPSRRWRTIKVLKKWATSNEKRNIVDPSPFSRVRTLVTNKTDLLKVSDRLNVNPSTVQKILEGSPVSRSVKKKIRVAFMNEDLNPVASKYSTVERLLAAHHLYEKAQSLRTVGEKMGLSRERVRQLLEKGSEAGLFEYKPLKFSSIQKIIPKQKILNDYKKFLRLKGVAQSNGISTAHLSKLIDLHQITEEDLKAARKEGGRAKCINRYYSITRKLGHHPTTTELQRLKPARYLLSQIRRFWGSFDAFRKELQIPSPQSRQDVTHALLKESEVPR